MNEQESPRLVFDSESQRFTVAKYGIKSCHERDGCFMRIIPMRDLKDTVEVERLCAQEGGPVFVTKNGHGCLVVMNLEYYNEVMEPLREAQLIQEGMEDAKNGKTLDGKQALAGIKRKYGI